MENDYFAVSRRQVLAASLAVPASLLAMAIGLDVFAAAREQEPTPACGSDEVTPSQTAGPFFKPRSPERKSLLEPMIHGSRIVLEGCVRSTKCEPVAGALLDFWQADASGEYDNTGYRLRGHQFADDQGRYRLETIVPGLYPGRTRHFHARVQAPNRPVLTTQLYFPGEAQNRRDVIFNPKLVVSLRDSSGDKLAGFDFILDLGQNGRVSGGGRQTN